MVERDPDLLVLPWWYVVALLALSAAGGIVLGITILVISGGAVIP